MIHTFLNYFIAKTDWMKTIVGISIISIFTFMVYGVFMLELDDNKENIIVHIIGVIEGMLVMIGNYYFGSSKGSQEKSEILKQHAEEAKKI
jgi:hypothetical protein